MDSKELQQTSPTIQDSKDSISIYKGKLTEQEVTKQLAKVMMIFPKFPETMLIELKESFADNNFNDERMIAAVKHVRDTYQGWDKLPNIANFVSFDYRVKIYTYSELCDLVGKHLMKWDDTQRIKLKGEVYYIAKSDYSNYKHLFGE